MSEFPLLATRAAPPRRAQPNGWWGMALFLCAEATLFFGVIATYFYLDFDARSWPPPGIPRPAVVLPLVATGVLVAMSLPMARAARAARTGRRGRVLALIGFAMVVQGCYFALQIILFRHDLNSFSPRQSAYGSVYFTLLALHHAHVLLGIALDVGILSAVAVAGLTDYWQTGVRALALYWHVINAIAIAVVLTQLSPSL